ncbi:MAG: hypothetical protein ACKO13_02910 [Cytophagales bacterium]
MRLFALLLVSFVCFSVNGQDSVRNKRKWGYYSHVGAVINNFAPINDALSGLGYPNLKDGFSNISYGLTMRDASKQSYASFSLSYNRSLFTPENSLTKDVRFRSWEFQITGHFDLVKHSTWMVYPFFTEAIGYGQLILFDNISLNPSFTSSAANLAYPNSKTWSSWYFFIAGGLGAERRLRFWIYDFYVGASGGYRLSASRFTEDYATNAAPVRLSGFEWNIKIRFEIWRQIKLNR